MEHVMAKTILVVILIAGLAALVYLSVHSTVHDTGVILL